MSAEHGSPSSKRCASFKKPRRRLLENTELEDIRPRTTSLPTRNEINRPGRKYLTPISDQAYSSMQPMRSFMTTPKGLINKGDMLRSRSNSSVLSSCSGSVSELAPQSRSRTGSSVSTGSVCSMQSLGLPGSPLRPTAPLRPTSPLCDVGPHYRVTALGCEGVGRRSLTQQFTTSQYLGGFDSSFSGGCDRALHVTVLLDGYETVLDIHVPQESLDLHSVTGTDAYVLVFTIDDRSTFERTTDLLYELRKMDAWAGPVILVANKCDLVRTRGVSTEEAKSVANTYDCKYIETSVVLNHNVDELLAGVVSQIRLKLTSPRKGPSPDTSCYTRSKQLLHKIFGKDHLSKSCENLYVL